MSDLDPRIRLAMEGDRVAAQAVLIELLPRVRNLIRYLVRGDADVDDIAQDALVAITTALPGYRGEGSLSSWADRIVVRTTFASLRRNREQRAREAELGAEVIDVNTAESPQTLLERRHFVAHLDRLSDELRHALVLHHVLEMSVPEIASHLSVPFETVRSRLRLGRAKMRSLLQVSENPGAEGAATDQSGEM